MRASSTTTTTALGVVCCSTSSSAAKNVGARATGVRVGARAPGERWTARATTTTRARGASSSGSSGGDRFDEDGKDDEVFAGFLPNSESGSLTPSRGKPKRAGKTAERFNGQVYMTPAERRRARDEGERLSKALASLGVASRRGADDLIFGGRVKVNGETVTAPQTKVNLNADVVMVDGKIVEGGVNFVKEHAYFMLNKPKGFVCSTKSNSAQGKTVYDLFEQWRDEFKAAYPGKLPPRLFTVGRLDVATTGLLLLTTDGDWSQRVAHPSSEVVKQYVVTANNKPTRAQIAAMSKGTEVDGARVVPVRVESMGADGGPANRILVEVVDGRNREVRVLCADAGVDVKNLKRTRVGGLRMPKELPLGKYVRLKPNQVAHVLDKGLALNGGTF
jgi:pseudouridine synthase